MARPLGYTADAFDKFEWFKSWRARCVNTGWYTLLYKLCLAIDQELDNIDRRQFEVVQVKQKFGGLRFYVHGSSEAIHELINKAEAESFKTCEVCGNKGRIRPGGWIMTLCAWHWLDLVFGKDSNPNWLVKFGALWDDFVGQFYGVGYHVSNYWTRVLTRKFKRR